MDTSWKKAISYPIISSIIFQTITYGKPHIQPLLLWNHREAAHCL
jgi:hypothetical protein